MHEIKVKVTTHGKRKFLQMYYDCPVTGKREQRSTKTANLREAERAAAVWEAELRSGRYKPASALTWDEFRERYFLEVVSSLARNTDARLCTVFNTAERLMGKPKRLHSVNADWMSKFQTAMRNAKLAEVTIRSTLVYLRTALKWAVDMELLPEVPKTKMPKRARQQKVMKGRPVTGEEFDRMLAKVEAGLLAVKSQPGRAAKQQRKFGSKAKADLLAARKQQTAAAAPSWKHLLRGLWWSGLRLGEALELWRDDRPDKICMDFSGVHPMLLIRAELEKGNQDRLLPITPEFAEFLQEVPEHQRRGPVFRPVGMRGEECRLVDYVGKQISNIGRAAGVKVNTDRTGKVKFASAHDLRRSFGARWAPKVMPAVLQQLMRHESIETTLRFYVRQNSNATAAAIWASWESSKPKPENIDTYVDTSPEEADGKGEDSPQPPTRKRFN